MPGERPRTFYRGYDPDWTGPRIRTGNADWDDNLFVSSVRERAEEYGPCVATYEALPEARILYEGTRPYITLARGLFRPGTLMLPSLGETVRRAREAGYDAVWFKRQGDHGTVVMNREAFVEVEPVPAPSP